MDTDIIVFTRVLSRVCGLSQSRMFAQQVA